MSWWFQPLESSPILTVGVSPTGNVFGWDGSNWVPLFTWSGTDWLPVKLWSGSDWI